MKIYTRTGDKGTTGLFGGARVEKSDSRIEALGAIDELNATLGIVRAEALSPELDRQLSTLQSELFVVGAEVACVPEKLDKLKMPLVSSEQVSGLENLIDQYEQSLPALTQFILPSGSRAGAALHAARTIARRAERRCLAVAHLRPSLVVYLNRLSDCLFVMARAENQRAGSEETPWQSPRL